MCVCVCVLTLKLTACVALRWERPQRRPEDGGPARKTAVGCRLAQVTIRLECGLVCRACWASSISDARCVVALITSRRYRRYLRGHRRRPRGSPPVFHIPLSGTPVRRTASCRYPIVLVYVPLDAFPLDAVVTRVTNH